MLGAIRPSTETPERRGFAGDALSRIRVLIGRSSARLLWLLCTASCAAGGSASGIPTAGIIQGKPKPGSSITHTQMCECVTCDPAKCCNGAEDAPPAESCGDSYDFSKNSCGLAIQSCQSRCHKQVWRIRFSDRCDDTRPESCCG